jgi:flagellar biosynthesis chaperone FliJ
MSISGESETQEQSNAKADARVKEIQAQIKELEAYRKELEVRWVADAVAGALEDVSEFHRTMLTRRCS